MSILKWAGGKTLLIPELAPLVEAARPERFVDLFCGSLALPLHLKPRAAVFNDINAPLINLYATVRDCKDELLEELEGLAAPEHNTPASFAALREEYNAKKKSSYQDRTKDRVRMAALFVYLNKRAFNGLYRENRGGDFNVSYRSTKAACYSRTAIEQLHRFLTDNDVVLCSGPYADVLVQPGDLVFIDPPYYPSSTSRFTAYWKDGFAVEDQHKLCDYIKGLDRRGIRFIMTNAPCDEVRRLYAGFKQKEVCVKRQMRNAKRTEGAASGTLAPNEIIVWNF